jgi:hypothetical protein
VPVQFEQHGQGVDCVCLVVNEKDLFCLRHVLRSGSHEMA